MKAVHQFLATFEPGAIGSHALELQKAFREMGLESEIFAEFIRPPFENLAHVHTEYGRDVVARDDDLLAYHMAIGSNVADWLKQQHQRLLLIHHNITPVEFYEPWDPGVTYAMAWGRRQLQELAERCVMGMGVSEYNRRELEALNYPKTCTVPLLLDLSDFDHDIDAATLARLEALKGNGAASGSSWLFVGWIAPHKAQHDIILAFRAYQQMYDPHARLNIVGRIGQQQYYDACVQLTQALGLSDSVSFTGKVTDGELGAHYKAADVLVCMSEHEGVGIPLLEAMHADVPVLAYYAAAVPETVGSAGIVLARKSAPTVAVAAHRLITDDVLRKACRGQAQKQLARFSQDVVKRQLRAAIDQLR